MGTLSKHFLLCFILLPTSGKRCLYTGIFVEFWSPRLLLTQVICPKGQAMQSDQEQEPQTSDQPAGNGPTRSPAWRAELNDNYCKLRRLEHPPIGYGPDGKLLFSAKAVADPDSFIVWDSNRDAPPGFGLKVAGKKTYILRRKVHGKSMLSKVGNFADFDKIQDARAKARELARTMVETGQNPNVLARAVNAAEVTLGQAMKAYRDHMVERTQRPAKPETLKVYDRVTRRHAEWGWSDR